MKTTTLATIPIIVCGILSLAQAADSQQYEIQHRIPMEGKGGGDLLAVDEGSGRLFVSHMTQVAVIDARTSKQIGAIPDTQGVHGVALAPDLNKGFVTCARTSDVLIFDLASLRKLARVRTGENPDSIQYEPATHRVFAFNGRTHDATVIDGQTNSAIATIPLDGKPELTATDGQGTVFVNLEDKSEVLVIDANAMKVTASWPLAPGEEPTGLALDPMTHRLFAGCHNQTMVVMDAQSGNVVTTVPIGSGVDGVGFDPGLQRVYSSNGEGTLTVVQEAGPDAFSVIGNVATERGARTLAVDTTTHHVFLPVIDSGVYTLLDVGMADPKA